MTVEADSSLLTWSADGPIRWNQWSEVVLSGDACAAQFTSGESKNLVTIRQVFARPLAEREVLSCFRLRL